MDLINNRYRIIKSLKHEALMTSYVAVDMLKNQEYVRLFLFREKQLEASLIDLYTTEFLNFTAIENENIIRALKFDVVEYIDNKKIGQIMYYYTTEYEGERYDLMHTTQKIEEKERFKAFIEICRAIYYLHLKGFIYGSINPEHIFWLKNSQGVYKAMLEDLATVELQKRSNSIALKEDVYFMAPEFLIEGQYSFSSDIYALGALLVLMFSKNLKNITNPQQALERLKEQNEGVDHFLLPLWNVIEKMILKNPEERYQNIQDLIRDINEALHTNYSSHNVEELSKLNFNTKIVGREEELQLVQNTYTRWVESKGENQFICIQGETGIGKTRILKEIEHRFSLKKIPVYSSLAYKGKHFDQSGIFKEIIRKLIKESSPEIVEKYESELVKIVPEIGLCRDIISSEALSGEKEKFRLVDRILSFTEECLKDKKAILLIDDLHLADEFSLEILKYIFKNRIKNIMIIFTYNERENLREKEKNFLEVLWEVRKDKKTEKIVLDGLNSAETAKMLKYIIMHPTVPFQFGEKIYSHTYGNPLFIQEAVKELFIKGLIYIQEESGIWYKDYAYSEMLIPPSIEAALLNQIKEFTEEKQSILMTISIFNMPVTIQLISGLRQIELKALESNILEMVSSGILKSKREGERLSFEFYNKLLKKIVYNQIPTEERKEFHKGAALILEAQYEDVEEIKSELIYQLEQAEERKKIYQYYLENAEKMESLNNRGEAILNLHKALNVLESEGKTEDAVKLMIHIASLYEKEVDFSQALRLLKSAVNHCTERGYDRYGIDALNKIIDIYLTKNDIQKVNVYITEVEKLLKRYEYIEGELEYNRLLCKLYNIKQEYHKAFEICERYIDFCGESRFFYKGAFYNSLGKNQMDASEVEKALFNFKCGNECYIKVNNIEGILTSLNNMGVVYGDYYQDEEKAIECFEKMRRISGENKLILTEILALTNLSDSYLYIWKYESAYHSFKDALDKSIRSGYEDNIFYCYNLLVKTCVKLNKYKEAYGYFNLAKEELKVHPEQGKEIGVFYHAAGELFYALGEYDQALRFIEEALEVYGKDEFKIKWESQVTKACILLRKDRESVHEQLSIIKKIIGKYDSISNKMNVICLVTMHLYDSAYTTMAKEFWEKHKILNNKKIHPRVKAKAMYIETLMHQKGRKLYFYEEALKIGKEYEDKKLQWRICDSIGDTYLAKGNYFYAVNYYFDACEIIKDLVDSVDELYKEEFITHHKIIQPFEKLKKIQQNFDLKVKAYSSIEGLNQKGIIANFKYEDFESLLSNNRFIKSAKKMTSFDPLAVMDIKDILSGLGLDVKKDLEMVLQYFEVVSLCTRGMIVVHHTDNELEIIASTAVKRELKDIHRIIEQSRIRKESIRISKVLTRGNNDNIDLMPFGVKSLFCIPVYVFSQKMKTSKRESAEKCIKGYVYLESEKILNNFTEKSLKKCLEIVNLIGVLIEEYNLKVIANIDKLTGTYTRKFFEEVIEACVHEAMTVQEEVSIIIYDVDNFKHVNDTFGHQVGDEVLKKISTIVMENIRKEDYCCRYGGEEFVVILPHTSSEEAYEIGEQFRVRVAEEKILGDKMPVTISIGISSYPSQAEWHQELIEKADQALYKSKESGKNRSYIWNENISKQRKPNSKLADIITGNTMEEYRNISALMELIELIKSKEPKEMIIFQVLGKVMEITSARKGFFFRIEAGKIVEQYGRKTHTAEWIEVKGYNKDIVKAVIEEQQGICKIDWDSIINYDVITGIPDWQSVIAIPLIVRGEMKGVLYLTVSTKVKEFSSADFSLANVLAKVAAGVLNSV